MSLPRELLDQLLSGYLDDALSADERARVEQLLQSDDEIVKELEQLRELQRSLQAVSAADSAIKLEKGFADRVLGAAVARAHAEGLSDDHPLVRLAEQPSRSSASGMTRDRGRSSSLKIASLLVGLAASIVVAVIALRPDPNQTAQTQPGTQSLPDSQNLAARDGTAPIGPIENPVEIAVENPIAVPSPDKLASDPPADPGSVTPDPVVVPDLADSQMKQQEQPPAPVEAIVKSDAPLSPPAVTNVEIPKNMEMIMVLEVRRTEAGRNSDPIGDALAHAEIKPASKKKITKEIAGFVKSNAENVDENASILYLQTTGKKVDKFYFHLLGDMVEIESVGLKIAIDAPIKKIVDAIRPDPTLIRHDEASLQLFSDGGVVDEFTSHLYQLDYRLVDRKKAKQIPVSEGPDITAQILVLIR